MLHETNTSYTIFIPDPEEQRRQIAIGLAVRSDTSGLPLLVDNFAGGGGASLGIEMSKSAQVRMIGNSVCPPVAAALIRANFPQAEQLSQAA